MSGEHTAYRICVVCWGNICRSPMAEFVLRQAFVEVGLGDRVAVESKGTSAEELGNAMDRRTISALRRFGVADTGFSAHRARRFEAGDFDDYDLVLAADHVHDRILRERARTEGDAGKVRLLRSFDPASVERDELGMDDPWYGGDDGFDATFSEIEAATPGIVAYVRGELDGPLVR